MTRSAKFIVPAFCLATALSSSGQVARFTHAVNNDWGTAGNWTIASGTPSLPPGASDTADFIAGGTATLSGNKSVSRITVSTQPVTFQGLSSLRTITMGGTGTATIGSGLTLDQVTLSKSAVAGGMTFTASLALANGGGITWNGTGNVTFNATSANLGVTGSGDLSFLDGSILFSGANTTTIASGVNFTSLGTISANQGTFDVASSSSSVSGTILFSTSTSATFRNSGNMSVDALWINCTPFNGGTDFFSNTGTLTKTGAGDLEFRADGGAIAYSVANSGTMDLGGTGTVYVDVPLNQSAGNLNFGGSAVVLNNTVAINGGTVTGNLTSSSGSGALNVTGGTISPGAGAGQVGSIAVPAALGLNGATVAIDVNGVANADAVTAGGAVTLSGSPTLSVTAPNSIANSTVFTILSGSSLTGTFAGLNNNATLVASGAAAQQFRINYSETDVTLTAVPEPHTIAAVAGVGLVGFAALRRWRWRA